MTATEELRRLLDERGVEWWPMHDNEAGYHEDRDTEFLVYGCKHVAHEWGCRLQVDMLTPEQAVAATLGGNNSDTVKRLMELQGGHYSWPTLYEAVTGDPFDYHCSPSESEAVFIEKLIGIVGGRKVVGE